MATRQRAMNETAKTPVETEADTPERPEKKEDSLFVFVLKLALVVFIFRSFFFASHSIPSESMLPKLWNGDYLAASKWSYGYTRYSLLFEPPVGDWRIFGSEPERGDIAVFKHPVSYEDYIKRVIGLPGDQIQMQGGALYINGEAVKREKVGEFIQPMSGNTTCAGAQFRNTGDDGSRICRYEQYRETLPNGVTYMTLDFGRSRYDDTQVFVVPEGHVFMMGDNRDNSLDSRAPAIPGGGVGFVPVELLLGKAQARIWSTDGSAEYVLPWTWFTAARWDRIGDGL
jgi:signal peptidase I